MAKKFKNRKKTAQSDSEDKSLGMDRNTEKPWESLTAGWRGREKYSRTWNSGYDGPGKGTN